MVQSVVGILSKISIRMVSVLSKQGKNYTNIAASSIIAQVYLGL